MIFIIQFEVLLVLGMINNFMLKPEYIGFPLISLGSKASALYKQEGHSVVIARCRQKSRFITHLPMTFKGGASHYC